MDFENILPGILTQIKREKKQIANVSFEIERKISSLAKPLRAFQLKKYIIYKLLPWNKSMRSRTGKI